jgi:hypothetical protein
MNNEIILANVALDENPAPNHNNNSNPALTGKIACLPMPLREPIRVNSRKGAQNPQTCPKLSKPGQAAPLGRGEGHGSQPVKGNLRVFKTF